MAIVLIPPNISVSFNYIPFYSHFALAEKSFTIDGPPSGLLVRSMQLQFTFRVK